MNRNLKGIQKLLASITMATSVLGMTGFAAFTPATALAVAPADFGLREGDTISADGLNTDANYDPDIYIVNDWGYKRLFLNPVIFNFYGHLGGFGAVKHVTPATRDAFGTSGLFRNCETSDSKVYAVQITGEDTGTLHWLNESGAAAVAEDPNFFLKVFCINNNEFNWYAKGSDYTSVSQVPPYTRAPGPTPTPNPTGAVSASLSSDNPSANTVIAGQAAADLAHFTFSGSGNVNTLVFNRLGVSSDITLSNVYLYIGSKRITDAAAVSQGHITFNDTNGLFAVNGSTTVSVKADIATGTSGQTVGVQLASYNGISTSISGNIMTIAATPADFGTLAIGGTTLPSAATIDPQNDYVMWQNTVTVGNHDLWLKSLQLRVIGSVNMSDLRNFRLYVDGVQVGTAVAQADANGYIVFDLSAAPVTLRSGSRILKLVGDIIGGSSRNFTVSLRQRPDIFAVESQYGQPVLASGTFPAAAGQQSIASGSLTITKNSDSPSGDVIKDASGAVLVRYKFEAHGEAMKVENLRAAVNVTGASGAAFTLRNGAVFADGVQIGSSAALCSSEDTTCSQTAASTSYTEYNLGSSLIVQPGTPRFVELRADIFDNDGTNEVAANVVLQALLQVGSSNAQRLTTLDFVNAPATQQTGNALTVKTGSFNASKFSGYANQSVVVPRSNFKIGHYALSVTSSEDVNVNTISVDVNPVSGTAFSAEDLNNMYLKVWTNTGSLILTTSPKATVAASNSYSVNFTVPHGTTYQVEVWSDINNGPLSSPTNGTSMATNLGATGLTTLSNTSVTASDAIGQTITAQTGSLTLQNGAIPADRLVQGGTTVTAYAFTLQPTFDDFTLDEAAFNLSSSLASSTGAVQTVTLKDSTGAVLATVPMNGGASVSTMFFSKAISQAGGTQTFTVEVATSCVGVGCNDTAGLVQIHLNRLKYHDSQGNVTNDFVNAAPNMNVASTVGNNNYVVKAYPVFANTSLPTTQLNDGENVLFKTTATSTGAQVNWRKVKFTAVDNGVTLSNFKLLEDGNDITSLASVGYNPVTDIVTFTFSTDRVISGTRTYELRGTVTGSASGDSVITSIANPSGTTVTTEDYATQAATAGSFIWTDSSSAAHSDTTDDWFTDGLLKTIATSEALSA